MKKEIILSGIVVVGIVLTYQNIVFKSITDRLDANINNINNISMEIDNVNSNIINTLEEELSKTYLTKEVNLSINTAKGNDLNLDIRAELSRASNDANVLFMYKEENSNNWESIPLDPTGGLSYIGNIDLDFSDGKLYSYKIVTEGELSESGDINEIIKYEFIPINYSLTYGEDYEINDGSLMLGIHKEHKIGDNGNTLLDEIKVDKGFEINNVEFIIGIDGKSKSYKANYEKAEVDKNKNVLTPNRYEVYIPKKDYKDKNLDYIKLKINYRNGFTDTRDITNEIDRSYVD